MGWGVFWRVVKLAVMNGKAELSKDLYEARDKIGGAVIHDAHHVQPHDMTTVNPYLTYTTQRASKRTDCDYIVGADSFAQLDDGYR
jgi:p-hydroxybenzoate 3-monooxygenase